MMKKLQFCSLSVINQTTDQAISLGFYYLAITTMKPKLQIVCLTFLYYVKFKLPIDIIHVPDACEAYTFFLPARNSLIKEIGFRKSVNQPSNFDLDYADVSDFTLVRDINIPPLTKDELDRLPTNIPETVEVPVHTLSNKLQEINRNYTYTMPDWLKIMLTITSTIIDTFVVVGVIYAKKSGNCLGGNTYRTTERARTPI